MVFFCFFRGSNYAHVGIFLPLLCSCHLLSNPLTFLVGFLFMLLTLLAPSLLISSTLSFTELPTASVLPYASTTLASF